MKKMAIHLPLADMLAVVTDRGEVGVEVDLRRRQHVARRSMKAQQHLALLPGRDPSRPLGAMGRSVAHLFHAPWGVRSRSVARGFCALGVTVE